MMPADETEPPDPAIRPIILAGPTASGKSDVALCLAELLGGDIVSVDSMQVYSGMDIGTAKPSVAERARVPHHLLDLVSVAETFDVSQFVKAARRAVAEIQARGRVPILCGGTGLYFKAYLHGIREAPATDSALRSELERIPLEQLLAELRSGDPTTYERVDRKNPRRVLRAVAVLRLGGPRAAEQGPKWSNTPAPDHRHFGLERDAADLRERVDARVDDMFRCGLVEETQRLLGQGLEQNLTAMQALGYRQVVEQLRGERNLAATIELVKRRTRQYVKRQRTWFRRQMSLNWIRVRAEEPADQIAARIEAAIRGTPS